MGTYTPLLLMVGVALLVIFAAVSATHFYGWQNDAELELGYGEFLVANCV